MIKLLLASIAATLILSGCMTTQLYDNNQFGMLVSFSVATEELKEQCNEESGVYVQAMLPELQWKARAIVLYAQYTPRDAEALSVAKILENDIKELRAHYDVKAHNKFYCKTKARLINKKAQRILEAVGKKRRK